MFKPDKHVAIDAVTVDPAVGVNGLKNLAETTFDFVGDGVGLGKDGGTALWHGLSLTFSRETNPAVYTKNVNIKYVDAIVLGMT